jgi:hypothetical protein
MEDEDMLRRLNELRKGQEEEGQTKKTLDRKKSFLMFSIARFIPY